MKSHERKAIENAVGKVLDDAGWDMTVKQFANVPHKAVRLAQLRASRGYGPVTEREALTYAKYLAGRAKQQVEIRRR